MAKKMSKKETEGYFVLAIVGGCVLLAVKLTEALGGMFWSTKTGHKIFRI